MRRGRVTWSNSSVVASSRDCALKPGCVGVAPGKVSFTESVSGASVRFTAVSRGVVAGSAPANSLLRRGRLTASNGSNAFGCTTDGDATSFVTGAARAAGLAVGEVGETMDELAIETASARHK